MLSLDIRFGSPDERAALEDLQRQASLVWPDYRDALLTHPDAIHLPPAQLDERRVRVAESDLEVVGFSVVLLPVARIAEVDGLFVKPSCWGRGIGRALMVDAMAIARAEGALALEVTANPRAEGFYTKCGFIRTGSASTRFGPALRMRCTVAESVQPL
ncbi:MAG: GNAT family N-acetyltransferase [Candidatus Baltobacteraceae bacterium]